MKAQFGMVSGASWVCVHVLAYITKEYAMLTGFQIMGNDALCTEALTSGCEFVKLSRSFH